MRAASQGCLACEQEPGIHASRTARREHGNPVEQPGVEIVLRSDQHGMGSHGFSFER